MIDSSNRETYFRCIGSQIGVVMVAWTIVLAGGALNDMAAGAEPVTPPVGAAGSDRVAARPLYRDPVYDNPTDPVVTYNAETGRWLMYYTQRRGGNIALIHGTKIGIAASNDRGATWYYIGTADITYGQDQHPNDYTYWAPEVIWVDGLYHMYLTFVPGIFNDWNHPREIGHLTSKDGLKWETIGKIDLDSSKTIDPCVIQLPDGNWRMFFKDEASKSKHIINYADSPDLYHWTAKGPAVTDRNGEGPKCFHFQGKYWLVSDTDRPEGQAIWSSEDATAWKPQDSTLYGSHGDVVVNGDRAWWIYFGGQRIGNVNWAVLPEARSSPDAAAAAPSPASAPATTRRGSRGISINVVELKVVGDRLMYTNPNQPVTIDLGTQREKEK